MGGLDEVLSSCFGGLLQLRGADRRKGIACLVAFGTVHTVEEAVLRSSDALAELAHTACDDDLDAMLQVDAAAELVARIGSDSQARLSSLRALKNLTCTHANRSNAAVARACDAVADADGVRALAIAVADAARATDASSPVMAYGREAAVVLHNMMRCGSAEVRRSSVKPEPALCDLGTGSEGGAVGIGADQGSDIGDQKKHCTANTLLTVLQLTRDESSPLLCNACAALAHAARCMQVRRWLMAVQGAPVVTELMLDLVDSTSMPALNAGAIHSAGHDEVEDTTDTTIEVTLLHCVTLVRWLAQLGPGRGALVREGVVTPLVEVSRRFAQWALSLGSTHPSSTGGRSGALLAATAAAACTALELLCRTEHTAVVGIAAEGGIAALVSICSSGASMSSATSVSAAAAQLLCRLAMKDSVKQQVQRAGAFRPLLRLADASANALQGTRAALLPSVGAAHSLYAAAASVAALSESDGTNTCSDGCAIMVRALEAASSAILAVGSSSRNRWHLTSLLLAAASHAADALRTYFRASEANSPADQSKSSSSKTKHLHQDAKVSAVPALVAILYTSAGSVEEAILMLTGQRPAFNEGEGHHNSGTRILRLAYLRATVSAAAALHAAAHAAAARAALLAHATSGQTNGFEDVQCFANFAERVIMASTGTRAVEVVDAHTEIGNAAIDRPQEALETEGVTGVNDTTKCCAEENDASEHEYKYGQGYDDDPDSDDDNSGYDATATSDDAYKNESVRLLITRSVMELAAMMGELAKHDDSCRKVAPMVLKPLVQLLHACGSASDTAVISWDIYPGGVRPSAVSAAAEALATFVSANVEINPLLQLPRVAVAACVRVAESCQKTKAVTLASHAQSLHMCARLICALGTRASERSALVMAGVADALASALRVARALTSLARQLQHLPSGDKDAKWTSQASAHGTFAAHHASATAASIAVDARLRGALVFDNQSIDEHESVRVSTQPSALLLLLVQQLGAFESTKTTEILTRERVGPSWSLPASKPTEAIALGARAAAAALSMLGQVRSARPAMVHARAPAALFSMVAKAFSCSFTPGEVAEETAEDVNHAMALLHLLAADTLSSESPLKFDVAASLLDGTQKSTVHVVAVTRAIVARLQHYVSDTDAPTMVDGGDEVLLVGATGALAAVCGVSAAPAVLALATVRRLVLELDIAELLTSVSRMLVSARANYDRASARRRAALQIVRIVERLASVAATDTQSAQSVALRLLQQNVCGALDMTLAASPADIDEDSRLALATLHTRVALMKAADAALRSGVVGSTEFGKWFQVHTKKFLEGVQQVTQRADTMTNAACIEAATLAVAAVSHALRLATVVRLPEQPSSGGDTDIAIETDGSALDVDIVFEAISCKIMLTLKWCMVTLSAALCDRAPPNTPRFVLRALRVSATLCEAIGSTCTSEIPSSSGRSGDDLMKLILKVDGGILQPLSSAMRACVTIAAPWSQKMRSHLACQHRMAAALSHDQESKHLADDLVTSVAKIGLRLAANKSADVSQAGHSNHIDHFTHDGGPAMEPSSHGALGGSVRTIGGVVIDGEGTDAEMAILAVLSEVVRSSANAFAHIVAQRSAKRVFSAGISSSASMISALLYAVATFGVGASQALPRVLGPEALMLHFNWAVDAASDKKTPSPVEVNLRPEMLAASSSTMAATTACVSAIRNLARLPAGRRLLLQHVMEDRAADQSPGVVTLDVLLALCRVQQHRLAFAATSESQQCNLPTWWIWLAQQNNDDALEHIPPKAAVQLLHHTLELLSVGTGALANVALDRESRALAATAAPRIFGLQCASLRPLPPCNSLHAANGDIKGALATLLRNTAAAVSLVARDGVPGGGAHEVLEVGCATHIVMVVVETVQQRRQVIESAELCPAFDKDMWTLLKFCVNVVYNLVAVVNDGGDGQVGAAGDGRRRELAVEADAARALSLVLGLLRDDPALPASQAETKARQQLARSAAGAIAALALHADFDATVVDTTNNLSSVNCRKQQRSNTQLVVDVAGAPHTASPILCLALATLAHGGAALAMNRERASAATTCAPVGQATVGDQAHSRRQMEADHTVTVALASTATSLARVVICADSTLSDLLRQSASDVAPLAAVFGVASAATATIADTAAGGCATAEARMAQRSLAAARAVLLPDGAPKNDKLFSAFGLDAFEFDALLSTAERTLLSHCAPRS